RGSAGEVLEEDPRRQVGHFGIGRRPFRPAGESAETGLTDAAAIRLAHQPLEQDLDCDGQLGWIAKARLRQSVQRKVIKVRRGESSTRRDHSLLMLAASLAIPAVKFAMRGAQLGI